MELLTESCVIISAISISKQQAVIEAASRNQLFTLWRGGMLAVRVNI
jgi:hypothetical protein